MKRFTFGSLTLAACILVMGECRIPAISFDQWKAANFDSSELANVEISGWDADPDQDGIRNFQEFALGTDPWHISLNALLAPQLEDDGTAIHLSGSYHRSILAEKLVVLPQVADDLKGWWRADQVTVTGGTIIDDIEYMTAKDELALGGPKKRFMRLLIAQDSDEDGLPDDWELAVGLNPFEAFDGMRDSDGDGDFDIDEFYQGTDPLDPYDNSTKQRIPLAPQNVYIRVNPDGTRDILWDDVSYNEEFFVIYENDPVAGTRREIGRVGPNQRVFRLPSP